jgi:hypothetical protein
VHSIKGWNVDIELKLKAERGKEEFDIGFVRDCSYCKQTGRKVYGFEYELCPLDLLEEAVCRKSREVGI